MYQEFMKKFIKKRALLVVIVGAVFFPFSFTHSAVLQVTESEGDRFGYELEKVELFFSIDNTYEDILEFAIGNNGAYQAGYRDDLALYPTANLANGFVAYRDEGVWRVNDNDDGPRELTWMNQASNFDGFTKAFLYTSLCEGCSGAALETGTTDGYAGEADESQSPFAAYSEENGGVKSHHRLDNGSPCSCCCMAIRLRFTWIVWHSKAQESLAVQKLNRSLAHVGLFSSPA